MRKEFLAVLCMIVSLCLMLAACGPVGGTEGGTGGTGGTEGSSPAPKPFQVKYRSGYTPEKFTLGAEAEATELGEGVHLVKNTAVKTNGQTCVVWTIEVDLAKADIIAGTKGNASVGFHWEQAAPYQMALDWEAFTDGHVYSSLNADFFGSTCVNAFVKDGCIVKDGHNDKGMYDYKDLDSDVPASAPMLFGIKGQKAQIAPIVKADGDPESASVKEQFVKGKLFYKLDGKEVRLGEKPGDSYFTLYTAGDADSMLSGCAVKVNLQKGMNAVEVVEVVPISGITKLQAGYTYLASAGSQNAYTKYLTSLKAGDTVSLTVCSPDGTWDGYTTILGCRQALVTGGKIAPTVTDENSNGAASPDVPRSAVGLKDDGTVVIFAVESLYYGNKAEEGDTHGMSLPELAEFAYFYGCNEAANFDGGGSTQLVVRGEAEEEGRVVIRSSDTASANLTVTRPVMNAILVVKR